MKTILQLSDFHIKATMGEPEDNVVFCTMVDFIKGLNLSNIILVYNGDVIDSKCIGRRIPESSSAEEKAALWEKEASTAFALAEKYFAYLMRELDIANNRMIICCGNHDVNMFAAGNNKVICELHNVEYGDRRFSLISRFIDKMIMKKNTYETHFRKIEGINFLVLNSHWIDKGTQKLCVDCDSIEKNIEKNKDALIKTKNNLSKQHNVLVAHAPRTDYCEHALLTYPENEYTAVLDQIETLFGLQLYGDKHTDSAHNYDYIVGAPLDSDHITCGLHQFSDTNQYYHRTIVYKDEKWQIVGSLNDIERILELSESSLKRQALRYLFGTKEVHNLAERVKSFEAVRSGPEWRLIDILFRSFATLQQPQTGMAGNVISAKDGLINTLSQLIQKSEKRVSVTLRGEARLGKSLFMSITYLNLLYKFGSGTFDFLPIYINLEEIIHTHSRQNENKDSAAYVNKIKRKVEDILRQGLDLSKKYNCRPCCMIDGLSQHVFYHNARIEKMIDQTINSKEFQPYAHFIYGIDTDEDLNLEFTPQQIARDAEYLIYFNRIRTHKVNSTIKYENFIRAFCDLNSYEDDAYDCIMENINRMQILEIDLNILVVFGEYLCKRNTHTFFDMLDDFVRSKLGNANIAKAAEMSYHLYMGKPQKNYTWIREHVKQISNQDFEVIRTQKLIARYLLAANYVLSAQNVKAITEISPHSGLDQLYGHEICSYIRGFVDKLNLHAEMISFAQLQYDKLSYTGKSTISHLLGRTRGDNDTILQLLAEQEQSLDQLAQAGTIASADFYEFSVAKRSICLSRIANSNNQDEMIDAYIDRLLSDKWERKVNRDFYLQFYGDRKAEDISIREDVVYEGFDIYNTYHLLASRLKTRIGANKHYPLLRLELFTLCDLVQVRIDSPLALRKNSEKKIRSFFYNSKYNTYDDPMAINILSSLIEIIDIYVRRFQKTNRKELFIQYLIHQKTAFETCKERMRSGDALRPDDLFDPGALLEELSQLERVKKTGWCIPDKQDSLSKADYLRIIQNGEQHETTLEHVFEAYLIGLLFLPSKSYTHSDYDKQKILNMLLIHDMGEAYTGDYPPCCVQYEGMKELESNYCEKVFLSGTHRDVADLTEYLKLWFSWDDQTITDYNIKIAKDIDKLQMLYKLLTLLYKRELHLTRARFLDFWKAVNTIRTDEGKKIFNVIIANNRAFTETAQEYDVPLQKFELE